MAKKRRKINAAQKGWATRRAKARRAKAAARKRAAARNAEQRKIERLLGEEFDNLAQARRALAEESEPEGGEISDLDDWEDAVDYAFDFDEGPDEYDGGVDYGEA